MTDRTPVDEFKPCVIEMKEAGFTEMVLEDCLTIWQLWGHEGIELGYSEAGKLVAIRVPGTVDKMEAP